MFKFQELSSRIWNIADDVLRGLFNTHEYGDVILPFEEVLRQIILSYVNNRVEFYQKMENPQVKRLITDDFYRDYKRVSL